MIKEADPVLRNLTTGLAGMAALASLGLVAAPVSAQETDAQAEDRINQLIVFGDDPCPASTGGEITVCARKLESERYRIPEILRGLDSPQSEAWNNKVLAYEAVLDSGTLSCSPSGAGGWTGCTGQMIQQAYAEKRTDVSLRFSELIAEERAKRLAAIDETAAETQARVEAEERARLGGGNAQPAAEPAP